jgi:glycosyltransferase involved in cell wall biosynthesis
MAFAHQPYVQVIVPARNEQDCIAPCLESLAGQKGIGFRITVVDDGSADQTRVIAESFPGVRVISPHRAVAKATGKCNALICGAKDVQSEWLLFTDADTVHYPGSLAAAVKEAQERGVDLLSYSPEQDVVAWAEQALMPVVFADLARTYPPASVNDPASPVAAANGQYILVRRQVYERLGGHSAVANKVLEDVELARLFKSAGRKIWFRHGAGLVKARMYRSFATMVEGWTKNLALLFRHPIGLAVIRALEFAFIVLAACSGVVLIGLHHPGYGLLCLLASLVAYAVFLTRILTAHFPWKANLAALFGLPLFAFLLVRSYIHSHIRGAVQWKGRTYTQAAADAKMDSSV